MITVNESASAIDHAIDSGVCFYACRWPDDEKVSFGAAEKCHKGLPDNSGFIIAPFDNESGTILSITADPGLTSAILCKKVFQFRRGDSTTLFRIPTQSTSEKEHSEAVSRVAGRLRGVNTPSKTVIARVLVKEIALDFGEYFSLLANTNPHAYVFCFHTPESGLWIGASPETLLTVSDGIIRTMALAGTRAVGSVGEWDAKNISEQKIVTEFISDVLSRHGMTPVINGPYTRGAGPVEHLCTDISAEIDTNDLTCLRSLLADLSPTPALCGFPRCSAMEDIRRNENFERGYYGGYAGIADKDGGCRLFVNLRCAATEDPSKPLKKMAFYAGGGIMPDSDPDSEWMETERKLGTLSQLISF